MLSFWLIFYRNQWRRDPQHDPRQKFEVTCWFVLHWIEQTTQVYFSPEIAEHSSPQDHPSSALIKQNSLSKEQKNPYRLQTHFCKRRERQTAWVCFLQRDKATHHIRGRKSDWPAAPQLHAAHRHNLLGLSAQFQRPLPWSEKAAGVLPAFGEVEVGLERNNNIRGHFLPRQAVAHRRIGRRAILCSC